MAERKEMKTLAYANHPSVTPRPTRILVRGHTIRGAYLADRSRVIYEVPAELVEAFEQGFHFQQGLVVAYTPDEPPAAKAQRKKAKAKTEADTDDKE